MQLIRDSPAAVWHAVVCARSAAPRPPAGEGLMLTALQEEGASRAASILGQYSGVIIADGVGMGKTFIALRLIEHARSSGQVVIIVVPATLRTKWLRALGRDKDDVIVLSHTRLPRHGVADALRHRLRGSRPFLVVDEAHHFRNSQTARYRALSEFTAAADVVLLTATPINNRLADLYWLLRLFLGDGDLRRGGVPSLRGALLDENAPTGAAARRVVAQVVIRRTRADLPNTVASRGHRFPRRALPTAINYDLAECYPELLTQLPIILERLPLAPFRLAEYTPIKKRQPIDTLVRIGLIKRLESSTWAFQRTVERLRRFVQLSADAAAGGGFLHARDIARGDPLQLALTGLLARPLPAHTDRDHLREDLALDALLLGQLHSAAQSARDPKAEQLETLLGRIGAEPRVVFTQYAETAELLFSRLQRSRVALLHGSRATLTSGPISRRNLLERFAPFAMGVAPPPQHERIDILICTDVLSEGLDLQDALHCISYDLPWNPVRLMQRIGRIDRMGSPHEEVYSWYFSPTDTVEDLLHLLRRLRRKIKTIDENIGKEAPVLSRPLRGRRQGESVASRQRSVWERLSSAAECGPSSAACSGTRVAHVHCSRAPARLAIFAVRGSGYGWWEAVPLNRGGRACQPMAEREIAQLLLDIHEEGFVETHAATTLDSVRCAETIRRRLSPATLEPDTCRKVAREIRVRLSRIPGGAPEDVCAAAESILLRLAGGLAVAQERAVRAILRTAPDIDLLLERLQCILDTQAVRGPAPRIVAIMIVER